MLNIYVIIDSNFLFLPTQFKIDYLYEITHYFGRKAIIIIYQQILDELNSKLQRESNAKTFEMNLNTSLEYLEKKKDNFNILFLKKKKLDDETTDDFLIRESIKYKGEGKKVFLATNDSELRKRANSKGVQTIYLKQKQYLAFDQIP